MKYVLSRSGLVLGTFSGAQLMKMAVSGQLLQSDLIAAEGTDDWSRAGDVADLFAQPPAATASVMKAGTVAEAASTVTVPMLLAFIGIALTAVGVFTPFVTLPIVGSLTYFNNGNGPGVTLLIGAGVAAICLYFRAFVVIGTIGVIALFMSTELVSRSIAIVNQPRLTTNDEGLLEAFSTAVNLGVQLQAGGFVLLLGSIALIASPLVIPATKLKQRDKKAFLAGGAIIAIIAGVIIGIRVAAALSAGALPISVPVSVRESGTS